MTYYFKNRRRLSVGTTVTAMSAAAAVLFLAAAAVMVASRAHAQILPGYPVTLDGAAMSTPLWSAADPFALAETTNNMARISALEAGAARVGARTNAWDAAASKPDVTNIDNAVVGEGEGLEAVDALTLAGYDIGAVMAVGSTYYFTTNLVSYGAVSGRSASIDPPLVEQVLTYAGPVTNLQYLGDYLIPSNQTPAMISRGLYSFTFYGGHAGTPSQHPTLAGELCVKAAATGATVQEFSSDPVPIPRGSGYFTLRLTVTNDIPRDGYAFQLRTKIIDRDGYNGDFTSYFGRPNYAGFAWPKVEGVFLPRYVFDDFVADEAVTYTPTGIVDRAGIIRSGDDVNDPWVLGASSSVGWTLATSGNLTSLKVGDGRGSAALSPAGIGFGSAAAPLYSRLTPEEMLVYSTGGFISVQNWGLAAAVDYSGGLMSFARWTFQKPAGDYAVASEDWVETGLTTRPDFAQATNIAAAAAALVTPASLGVLTAPQTTNAIDNAVATSKIKRLYEDPGTNYVAVTGSNLVLYASGGTEYFRLTFTGVYNSLLAAQPWTSPYTVSSDGHTSNNWSISINKLPGYASYSYVRSVQGDDWWRNTTYPSDFPLTMTSIDGGYGSVLIERVLAPATKTFASTDDLKAATNGLLSATGDGSGLTGITAAQVGAYSVDNPDGFVDASIINGLLATNGNHSALSGRDAVDSHPTSAITGLDASLAALAPSVYQSLTNLYSGGLTTTVAVAASVPFYRVYCTNSTAIAITPPTLAADQWATWETALVIATTNISVSLPPTNLVSYITTPTLTTTSPSQTVYLVWRTMGVSNIVCNQWLSR